MYDISIEAKIINYVQTLIQNYKEVTATSQKTMNDKTINNLLSILAIVMNNMVNNLSRRRSIDILKSLFKKDLIFFCFSASDRSGVQFV